MYSQQEIDELLNQGTQLVTSLHPEDKRNNIALLESQLISDKMWEDSEKAARIQKEISLLQKNLNKIDDFDSTLKDLVVAVEMNDQNEINQTFLKAHDQLQSLKKIQFLDGPFDTQNVFLSIHSGAGGVDAQDFAAMLLHMYQAFAKSQMWVSTLVSLSPGEEAGIKSAVMRIEGEDVYGLMKEEAGVHRLVRLSPFNSGKTRETSFALVEVVPSDISSIVETKELDEKDLRWDYFMSSGKGGQSVNTTYSAVRLVHIPTGISVTCQNERNQQQNKQQALKYLQNKLAAIEAQKIQDMKNEIKGQFVSIEWGSQIRSYVLHPYKMVKDHRNGWQTSSPESILEEGNLYDLIWSLKTNSKTDES